MSKLIPKLFICYLILTLISCNDSYPRKKGYLRISVPETLFTDFEACSFKTKISSEAVIKEIPNKDCWFKLSYPTLKADLHFSSVEIQDNFADLVNSVHNIKDRHSQVATFIPEESIANNDKSANGILFKIQGKKAASPLSFYLTDSTKHFVTASLYFNHSPNNDSIQPIIKHIMNDVDSMIYNWKWN